MLLLMLAFRHPSHNLCGLCQTVLDQPALEGILQTWLTQPAPQAAAQPLAMRNCHRLADRWQVATGQA